MKSFIAPTILACYIVLSGCNHTPHGRDIEGLYLVFRGKTTYKQSLLWFERTTYEALVHKGEYFVNCRPRYVRERRTACDQESVRDVIADIAGSTEEHPSSYFLVRGIDESEKVYRGSHTDPQAADLTMLAGDLLVIESPTQRHLLPKLQSPSG